MNEFKKHIKVPTQEEKRSKIIDIIISIINFEKVLTIKELKEVVKDITKKLSEDEIIAAYNLAIYLKKTNLTSKPNNKLNEFIDIANYCRNDNGNLMKFIKETVIDIQERKKNYPNSKWELQVDKIFDRIDGKNPYEEEMKFVKRRKENIHLVK